MSGGLGRRGMLGSELVPAELQLTFTPLRLEPLAEHPVLGVDGPDLHCAFETGWCARRVTLAGGLDVHHRWPLSLGGPVEPTDVEGRLLLCPIHHRRQHALIRAMVESGATGIRTVRYFAPLEWQTAAYAVGQWIGAGRPRIPGWPTPAAAVRPAA